MKQLTMPQLALGAEEVVLLAWLVEVGAPFATGDPIAEIDTDKAAMEVEAPFDGVLLARLAGEGDIVAVGAVYGHAAEAGEDLDEARRALQELANGSAPPAAPPVPEAVGAPVVEPVAARATGSTVAFLTVSEGELAGLPRALPNDLRASSVAPAAGTTIDLGDHARAGPAREQPLGRARRAIARRMLPAAAVPTFTVTREVQLEAAETAVAEVRAGGVRATLTDVLLAACAAGAGAVPAANAWLDDMTLVVFERVAIALAVDTEDGVSAPVLRDLGGLDLAAIAEQRADLVERARACTLVLDELVGATITLSNVAGLGAHSITPVLTLPQVAAIGVGGASGSGAARAVTVTFVGDHRALDGADGARFLAAFAELVQQPPWRG